MVGHGFNAEISQNKAMANNFDNKDNLKSQHISSNQSISSENVLGKKIKVINICSEKKN